MTLAIDSAPPLASGWRYVWSPLVELMGHLVELMNVRALAVGEVAQIEASALRADLSGPPSRWVFDLFERLALDATTGRVPLRPDDAQEARALCAFLLDLRGSLGLEVDAEPWGIDWCLQDLALRVFIAVPGQGEPPFYEIGRL